jgi:DNA replication initiation complex subunit (GINS family)
MPVTPSDMDRLFKKIRDYSRIESSRVPLNRINQDFYSEVREALLAMKEMAEESLSKGDIDQYIGIREREGNIKKSLSLFFQKRYEKILRESLYDIEGKTLDILTPQEREFIMKMHNEMMAIRSSLIDPGKIQEKQPTREDQNEPTIKEETNEPPNEPKALNEFSSLRITADYMPIALKDGNYYLRKNDIIYLPKNIAEILLKRESAVSIK